jgi:anti-sigma B factor antagonist
MRAGRFCPEPVGSAPTSLNIRTPGARVSVKPLLSVSLVREGAGVRVVALGQVDLSTAGALDEQLRALWASGCRDVTVDLRGLTFMDTTGVYVLLDAHSDAEARGGAFAIIAGPPNVQRLLAITGAAGILSADREEPALARRA